MLAVENIYVQNHYNVFFHLRQILVVDIQNPWRLVPIVWAATFII